MLFDGVMVLQGLLTRLALRIGRAELAQVLMSAGYLLLSALLAWTGFQSRSSGLQLAAVLVALAGAAIAWHLSNPQPEPLSSSAWERRLAQAAHRLLYLLPLLLVVSGYLISTADGRPVDVFGWFELPATLQGIEGQEDIAGEIHFALAMILLTLIVLHLLAALRHHYFFKDDTLRRMFRTSTDTTE